ncbi:MAG: GtrA family protein, partial [Selenomonas sp.]|nr:GtrA family protein [Selenomonas sp.]
NLLAYIINGVWIFREALSWQGYGKFALSYVPNFLCENLVVGLCYNLLGLPPVVSYLLAAVLAVPITYLLVKYFAFGGAKE